MSELSFVSIAAGWCMKAMYVLAVIMLGIYIVDRGRKVAAVEQAEESRDRRVA